MKQISILFGFLILLSSCEGFFDMEKEIDLTLPNANNKIVVQGVIQAGYPAYVMLTKSDPYFEAVANTAYEDLFITDAVVHVSNTYGETVELININNIPPFGSPEIDMALDTIAEQYPGFYIEWPFEIKSFPPYHTLAEYGERYNLSIVHNNDTITSTTTVPHEHGVDSLWFTLDPTAPREDLGNFWFHYTDPDTLGNTIMFEHKRLAHIKEWTNPETNQVQLSKTADPIFAKALWGFVRNDFEGLNGTDFDSYFQRGNLSDLVNDEWDDVIFEGEERGFFKTGRTFISQDSTRIKLSENDAYWLTPNTEYEIHPDTVLIRISQIDNASYLFWRSADYQSQSTGNPFAEPINLQSNIKGGYGVWYGQSSFYYKAVAKEDTTIINRHYPFVNEIL